MTTTVNADPTAYTYSFKRAGFVQFRWYWVLHEHTTREYGTTQHTVAWGYATTIKSARRKAQRALTWRQAQLTEQAVND